MPVETNSVLSGLLAQQAELKQTEAETGKDMSVALEEINRQIEECLQGDPTKDQAITESN